MRILIDVGNSVTKVVLNKDYKITIVKSINYIGNSKYELEFKKTIKSILSKNKISDVFTSSVNIEALKIIKNDPMIKNDLVEWKLNEWVDTNK